MQCPVQTGNPEVILEYSARRLNPETNAVLERHIELCAECRGFASAQKRIWAALAEWDVEPVSGNFDDRLFARIDEEKRRRFWTSLFGDRFAWKPVVPLAAACATAVLALVFTMPNDRTQERAAPVPETSRTDALDPEQVERTLEDLEMLKLLGGTSAPGAARTL